MAKYRLTLRQGDLDIIKLFYLGNPKIIIDSCLNAYLKGLDYTIPDVDIGSTEIPQVFNFRLILDDYSKEDAFLRNIEKSKVNSVLKILIRFYMQKPDFVQYMIDVNSDISAKSIKKNISQPAVQTDTSKSYISKPNNKSHGENRNINKKPPQPYNQNRNINKPDNKSVNIADKPKPEPITKDANSYEHKPQPQESSLWDGF